MQPRAKSEPPQIQRRWLHRCNNNNNNNIKKKKRLKVEDDVVEEDRISGLTIDLKHRILSRLSIKEAFKTSVLSSSWKHVWLTLPSLDFGSPHLQNYSSPKINYVYFIDKALTNRRRYYSNMSMEKLKLYLPEFTNKSKAQEASRYVNKWIRWAVDDFRVTELDFRVHYSPFEQEQQHTGCAIEFPMSVFDSGLHEITSLMLYKCALRLTSPLKTGWPTLKTLILHLLTVDQVAIDSITTNCPSIERIIFSYNRGQFHSLNASGLTRLRELIIRGRNVFKTVDINASHLQELYWNATVHSELVVNGLSSTNTSLSSLQTLEFHGNASLTDAWLERNLAKFSQLQRLVLIRCPKLKQLKITSCPHLTDLYLRNCNLEQLEIHAPRLELFSYLHKSIPSFQLNAPALKAAYVDLELDFRQPPQLETDQLRLYEELIMFLTNFKDSNKLELQDYTISKYTMIPPHMRSRLVPPLHNVKHLNISLNLDSSRREHRCLVELVDTLLWLVPSPESLFIFFRGQQQEMKLLKFKYFESDDNNNDSMIQKCDRCVSLPIQCWKHRLEEITIENDKGIDTSSLRIRHDIELRGYFEHIAANRGKIIVVKFVQCSISMARRRHKVGHYEAPALSCD